MLLSGGRYYTMAAKKPSKPKKVNVVKGSHSVRTEYSDGSVDFVIDWKKLNQQVSQAIKDYETSEVTAVKPKTKVSKKKL